MAHLSTNGANRFLTWMMTSNSVARPGAIYAAAFTSTTAEVSGNGYSRKAVTFSNGNNRSTSNTSSAEFTASGGNWGTVTHIGLFDAASGGQLLWQGPAAQAKPIENGDSLLIQSGAITIALN